MRLGEAALAAGGRLRGGDGARELSGVSTDTRTLKPGALFVALKGPRFDGHDHLAEASRKGAAAALVARGRGIPDLPCVEAEDPLEALGRLAAWHLPRTGARVAGITGSNGKTTTKEMLAAACRADGPTVASPLSFNNAIGLPLTCLAVAEGTKYAVLEMGANAPGEIAGLCRIAAPEVGVVTNIGRAHLEGFGSLEGVAKAKGELVEAVAARGGTAVLNADDPAMPGLRARARGARVVTFGLSPAADVGPARLGGMALRGRHNLLNATAALAAALALGVPEAKALSGLAAYSPPPMRLQERSAGGIRLVNDAYNANPDSLAAALEWLKAEPARRRLACLGGMRELGAESARLHREAGAAAARSGVEVLVGVGSAARWYVEGFREAGGREALEAADAAGAASLLRGHLRPGDLVLFKASRAEALERAVEGCLP